MHGQGLVESQRLTQFRLGGLGGLRPKQHRGRVARRQLDKQENHDRHAEDHWQNPDEPSCDESGHRARRYSTDTVDRSYQSSGGLTNPFTLGDSRMGCRSSSIGT